MVVFGYCFVKFPFMCERVYSFVAAKGVQPIDCLALVEGLVCFRKVAGADRGIRDVNQSVDISRVRFRSQLKILKGVIGVICKKQLDAFNP
jgi:hypothetical protein